MGAVGTARRGQQLVKARAPRLGLSSEHRRALRGHLWEEGDKEKSGHREKI